MKRWISIALSLCMMGLISACGTGKNNDDILTFFQAFDHTLQADSGQIEGSLTIHSKNKSTMHVKAQFNQKETLQLALQVGLEANGKHKDDYLDFYIKDGKTYLKNLDTRSQSVASRIGIKDHSKLSAYNPFLNFKDEELVQFFKTSQKNGNQYTYTIDGSMLSQALDSYGTVKVNHAALKATIKHNVITHLELSAQGKQTIAKNTSDFEFTIQLELNRYNTLSTVRYPSDLDSYPVSSTAK